jgi:N6-adenosine-specific RNA methylase IME4/ParB-like chromosome segregation protein Spo0J
MNTMQITTDNIHSRTYSEMKFHRLADLFPLIEGEEFDALVDDIRQYGQHEPVVLYQDQILDGRNRYRACLAAGVACWFEEYDGEDPLAFVVSLNLKRRHLNESQRAMVAAKLATLHDGQRADLVEGLPIGRASDLLNVGERSVARAREVQDRGAPELQRAVERGEVSVSAAADVATLPVAAQREIVARGEREILAAAKEIRSEKAKERYAARVTRIARVSAANTPLTSERRYSVIYADPPWDYEVYNETSGSARTAAEHYPTMKLEEICSLPVADIATDDAVLFLWATAPHLQQSFDVLAALGFEYKTNAVWVKHAQGLGFFVRGQRELLLIATRGDIPCPLPENRPPSVIEAPRREHSRKPDEAYELIERMYPDLPKIELFARGQRSGWSVWGNQADGIGVAPEQLETTAYN